ncbi:MAG: tRNA (guanosine(46)-N7)-methyltransferase TrmB, partial [bacterium]|nr:tRNA (guanosine(46)-N7)-methyltransferase TrmB [Candidatus Aquidulcis frankliniae]
MEEDVSPTQRPHQRRIRSFVLRAGRITGAQQRALDELWPRYGIDGSSGTSPTGDKALDLDAVFGRRAPRSLEIGFGNGENLLGLARAHPERDFIGVEVHRAGVGHLLLEADASGIGNLRLICHDAVEVLERAVAPGALDEVLILFPDPWHKKRHHKRRLVQPEFVELVASRLAAGGRLQLATDWEPYAQQMLEVVGANPKFINKAGAAGFVERPTW